MADLAAVAAGFGHQLQRAGIPVSPGKSARFAAAVGLVRPSTLGQLRQVARTTLLSNHDQDAQFDQVFGQVFGGSPSQGGRSSDTSDGAPTGPLRFGEHERPASRPDGPDRGQGGPDGPPETDRAGLDALNPVDPAAPQPAARAAGIAASSREHLMSKNFAECTPSELELIAAALASMPFAAPQRRGRRQTRGRHRGQLDIRATLRAARRTGGDPVHRVNRDRAPRPRRVVLLADVSGSMEPYSRVYLHVMREAVLEYGAEAFVFATRLTRLTRLLREGRPAVAYAAAARAAPDWSGGTRIGHALETFVNDFGRRGMARGSVLVIISDGWEVDEPAAVAATMRRLGRMAFHVIWVNPRKAVPGYEPLVGGMAAALPFVDTFVSGHSAESLADVLSAIYRAGAIRHQQRTVRDMHGQGSGINAAVGQPTRPEPARPVR